MTNIPSLLNITLSEAQQGLRSQQFTCRQLVQTYLNRISETNSTFHPVLETNPSALTIADSLDEDLKSDRIRGPLHGIPFLIKDNIATKDDMETTAGSHILIGARPGYDAPAVAKLREAGAVILGKANLSAWAKFGPGDVPSGWSPRGGNTFGAVCENMRPGGSSSGSAVAVALGLCFASLGNDHGGALIEPTSRHAVIGLKPTVGLVSNDGMIPISRGSDSIGPITRNVHDAAAILNIIVQDENGVDYVDSCRSTDLNNITIGIPNNAFPTEQNKTLHDGFDNALMILKTAGATIKHDVDITAIDTLRAMGQDDKWAAKSKGFSFKEDVEKYLSTLATNPNGINTLEDMLEAAKADPREQVEKYGTYKWDAALRLGKNKTERDAVIAEDAFLAGEGGVLGAMELHGLEVIAIPLAYNSIIGPASRAGLPMICVPMGIWPKDEKVVMYEATMVDVGPGIPFCITFIGKPGTEATLIKIAYAFEQLTQVRDRVEWYRAPRTELPHH